jgi:hypothetical protein
MKNFLKIMSVMAALTVSGSAFAQTNIDLVLTGGPNLGVYPALGMAGTYDITLSNGSGQTIAANHFMIVLSIPNGITFDATYPGLPAGWSYTVQPGGLSVNLQPTAAVSGFPPSGIVPFHVPFHTVAPVNNQPFLGQIQVLVPSFQDPDNTNNTPQGSVTVLNAVGLPVHFTSFAAKANGCKAGLAWTTAQETGSKYFDVQRSADGIRFESIGSVEAKGDAGKGGEYVFTDENPISGKNFYRVKQYDVDGKGLATNTQSVTISCGTAKIDLFPNPTSEIVNVKGLNGKNIVKLLTISGQEVMRNETEMGTYSMQVSGLASGTYQVQVVKNGEIIFNGKFVKAD